ncbi:hypothetical protein DH2020_043458 [Rehmannia glutinosa]|uniref:C2 domain-containing protein n=1 Tax=Rehmannia glutinosa TaxID=99300 RepID=A0ABR0UK25_REHGL
MAPGLKPFQLLEINIISAQDLEPVFKKMKTYARAWVNPNRKLSSCVDAEGNNNPTWNDKFVFRVDEDFLREDTSAVMIEIHASHWFRDVIVGTVRVLVGNLIPPPMWSRRHNQHIGMRFVRRPSGRPQGILNIGVALLDGSMRSMPLYTQVATSAVGYRLKKKGKASSVISGAELREPKQKGKKGKASSVVSDSVYSKMSSGLHKMSKNRENKKKDDDEKQGSDGLNEIPTNKVVDEKSVTKYTPKEKPPMPSIGKPGIGGPIKGNSIWSESEVGPSPSEVAAVMAERRYPLDDNQSSVLDGWSLDESVEGLRSKLERWRMELPPVYDHGGFSSSSYKSSVQHGRKRSESGSGLFSCFGNICGYECQCVCGKPPGRRSSGSRFLSSSVGTPAGRSFI